MRIHYSVIISYDPYRIEFLGCWVETALLLHHENNRSFGLAISHQTDTLQSIDPERLGTDVRTPHQNRYNPIHNYHYQLYHQHLNLLRLFYMLVNFTIMRRWGFLPTSVTALMPSVVSLRFLLRRVLAVASRSRLPDFRESKGTQNSTEQRKHSLLNEECVFKKDLRRSCWCSVQ